MLLKIDRCVSLITGFKDKLYHLKGIRPLRYPFKAWYSRKNQWYPIISGFPWLFQVYMSKIAVHDRPPLQPTCDFLVFTESISINSGQKCPTSTNLIVFNLVEKFWPIFKFSQVPYFFSLISLLFIGRYGFIPLSPYSPAFQMQKKYFFEPFLNYFLTRDLEDGVYDVIIFTKIRLPLTLLRDREGGSYDPHPPTPRTVS